MKTTDMSTTKKQRKHSDDSIFDEIEAELPEDLSNLMVEGRRIESHSSSRSWLDDDGR
jgi:hypothetical protein